MKPFRRVAAIALRGLEAAGLFELLERGESERSGVLRVLTYHRVGDVRDRSLYPGLVSASPQDFAEQMRWIAEHYQVVSVEEVLHCARSGVELPPRALLLTFDDAYADFAEHAWPVLAGLGMAAVVFVPTAFPDVPDRSFWWDRLFRSLDRSERRACTSTPLGRIELGDRDGRLRAFRRLRALIMSLPHERAMRLVDAVVEELGDHAAPNPVLGWDPLRALARAGVTLCPHTRTHPALDRLPADEVRREVRGSVADLERELGSAPPPVFAYPAGRLDEAAVRILGEEGIELAFTTQRGLNQLGIEHPLRLRRINVSPRATEPVLRAQLMGWMAALRRPALLRAP